MANSNSDVLQRLRDGIAELTTSEEWARYLDVQRKFHHYSWGNCILIASQRPDATRVAGYRSWQQLDRQVRRGEHAIMIIAPIAYKNDVENESTEPSESRTVRGFRAVPVFDVSQTDGKPLPEVAQRLSGDDPAFAFRRLQTVGGDLGYTIVIADFDGTANGDCNFDEHRIRVRDGLEPAQQVKTLAHELGHAVLHNPERRVERPVGRNLAELEAESVAYIACQELGIDSGDYSFGYITHWAGDGEQALKSIEASAAQIQHAAHLLLTALGSTQPEPPQTRAQVPEPRPQTPEPQVQSPRPSSVPDLRDQITSVIPAGRGGMDWPGPMHRVDGRSRPSLLLTVPEACAELRVSRAQIYIMANKKGLIEMVHVGKLSRIPRASLESYVNSLRRPQPETTVASHPEPELES